MEEEDGFEPVYVLAGLGDADAQAELVDLALGAPGRGVCSEEEALCGAEIIAHIAATHGRPADQIRLAGILLLRSQYVSEKGEQERADFFVAEAAGVLRRR